jgi:hypothetical protein
VSIYRPVISWFSMGRALPAKFLPSLFTIYFRSDLQKKTL